ncbi:hypothetical protein [Siminovitchia sp. 179-K 8D1 HS]|uniref:hypothetical protein n=1 Tax=Siminovitchia sp. 179-K 8D1 HS TaxID=3142385 RepID=UPI0039A111D3
MYYVYESHLSGEAYVSFDQKEYEELYCEQCGDSDWELDAFETVEEAEEFAKRFNDGEID